jgi:hypothetical protein
MILPKEIKPIESIPSHLASSKSEKLAEHSHDIQFRVDDLYISLSSTENSTPIARQPRLARIPLFKSFNVIRD